MIDCKSEKTYESKTYLHFDGKRVFNKKTKNYVSNPKNIESHSFYPLIRYIKKFEKHKNKRDPEFENYVDTRPIKIKKRKIMYASHIDNFIYKYYGDRLNEFYNRWVRSNHIDKNAIAYRYKPCEVGKSNIHYAAEVINAIHEFESCYIFIGDFSNYFDTLDHDNLKKNLCEVLGEDWLPTDWFKVFHSVTKFSYYNKRLLNKYCGSDKKLRRSGQYKYFKNPKDFRKFKSKYPIQRNTNSKGIPQGTAISAILSNVYAINFDIDVKNLVNQYGGLYRRYSDDFIIIIPLINEKESFSLRQFNRLVENIYSLVKREKLNIKEEKTERYYYDDGNITNLHPTKQNKIDFLGFVFNGKSVEMRGKSPYKFSRHANKIIRKAKRKQRKKGLKKIPYRRKIYSLYTDLGIHRRSHGNFITYAKNSQKVFDEISPHTNNCMMQQIKNRKSNLEKALGYKISISMD